MLLGMWLTPKSAWLKVWKRSPLACQDFVGADMLPLSRSLSPAASVNDALWFDVYEDARANLPLMMSFPFLENGASSTTGLGRWRSEISRLSCRIFPMRAICGVLQCIAMHLQGQNDSIRCSRKHDPDVLELHTENNPETLLESGQAVVAERSIILKLQHQACKLYSINPSTAAYFELATVV